MDNKPTRFSLDDLETTDSLRDNSPKTPDFRQNPSRLEFKVNKLTQLITDRGIDVKWEHAYLCTCRNKVSLAPNPNCPICKGKGVAYLTPIDTKIAIQGQERDVENSDLGLYSSGTAIGSTYPNIMITFRDRITVPEVSIGQSMIFDVTQERIDEGFWIPFDVKKITLAVTEGNRQLVSGTDFEFTLESNTIKPSQYLLGKNISLNLETTLRYIVIDLLKESRYQTTNKGDYSERFDRLPKKILLKREDAWVNHMPFSGDDSKPVFNEDEQKRPMDTGGFFGGVY